MNGAREIDSATSRAIRLFGARVRSHVPDAELVLFGSRARGDHTAESDLDVAVITERMPSGRQSAAGALADLAYDVLLETGVLVAPLPLTRAEWDDPALFSNPHLIEAIQAEGRPV